MTANFSSEASVGMPVSSAVAVARLTALWALAESALGGIVHALRIPLSGLAIAGTAVILISLIAHFAERPRDILRATLLVLIVKAVGAPHTQLVGYLAVGFQGVFAFAVYSIWSPGRGSTLFFATVALVETAVQKLLTLAIFFGLPLWEAVDEWGGWILQRYFPAYVDAEFSLAMSLVGVYVGIYLLGGLAIGFIAGRLPVRIAHERKILELQDQQFELSTGNETATTAASRAGVRQPEKTRTGRLPGLKTALTWMIVVAVLAASVYASPSELSPIGSAAVYLVRTMAILAIWYFLIGPILSRALQRWLVSRSEAHSVELEEVLAALPLYRRLATEQYRLLSRDYRGVGLVRRWVPRVLTLSLITEPSRLRGAAPIQIP